MAYKYLHNIFPCFCLQRFRTSKADIKQRPKGLSLSSEGLSGFQLPRPFGGRGGGLVGWGAGGLGGGEPGEGPSHFVLLFVKRTLVELREEPDSLQRARHHSLTFCSPSFRNI